MLSLATGSKTIILGPALTLLMTLFKPDKKVVHGGKLLITVTQLIKNFKVPQCRQFVFSIAKGEVKSDSIKKN